MKISKIKISKYHQFEDFELDLTYPKGHEKEGQPLDKVCFIGQSGTGKTTLLELIKYGCICSTPSGSIGRNLKLPDFEKKQGMYFKFQDNGSENFQISIGGIGVSAPSKDLKQSIISSILYFPIGLTNINLTDKETTTDPVKLSLPEHENTYEKHDTWLFHFNHETIKDLWRILYQHIQRYQRSEANFRIRLTKKAENGQLIDIKKELEKWKNFNPNPLEDVAKYCLDVFLNRFHLMTKTEIDDIGKVNALQICSTVENFTIPYDQLSTGTKQIIYTAFPIYQLLEPDSIVLMDEPETSLYPDIQKEIIDYYTSFDKEKKSQFFFATHSPIIASSFEPWEIVELKFDGNGKVYRELYYPPEEENHVENYKIDPRYLRWDDILTKVFDMEEDSNAAFRSVLMTEYTILKNQIKELREKGKLENPTKETKKVVDKFERAYDLLTGNWAVTRHEKNR